MKNTLEEILGGICGTSFSVIGTAIAPTEVLQIISICLTILGSLISIVIIPLYNWYKNSKKDGKITKEELNEGIKIATENGKEFANEVVEVVEEIEKEKTKNGK